MRRFLLASGIACAILLASHAVAQNPGGTVTGGTTAITPGGGFSMPGQVVGTYHGQTMPVGNQFPNAGQQVGQPITAGALQRPYDPNHPYDQFKGTNIDTKQILAPLVGPDGKPVKEPDALDKLSEKIKAFFIGTAAPPKPNYAPGIVRRKKERPQLMWRRD